MTRTTALALILAVGGCVSLSPAGEHVRFTRNALDVQACTSLGALPSSSSGWGGFIAGPGFENNKRALQNETAARGGDTLLIVSERGSHVPETFGEAYRCGR